MRRNQTCRRTRRLRGGAALLILIAVFAVTLTVSGLWTRRAVRDLQLQTTRERRAAARQLAESGVRRAVARLSLDANFRGELWRIDADELGGVHPAEVQIVVEPPDDSRPQAQVVARARYPIVGRHRVQFTKTLLLEATNQEPRP